MTGAGKEHEAAALSLKNCQEQNNILASQHQLIRTHLFRRAAILVRAGRAMLFKSRLLHANRTRTATGARYTGECQH